MRSTRRNETTRRDFLYLTFATGTAGLLSPKLAYAAVNDVAAEGWSIGCYTRPWDKLDYRVALDAIREAGFKYVGLMTTNSETGLVISVETTLEEAKEVGAECKNRGLEIPSVYGGGIPIATSLGAGIEGLRKLIDNCAAAGAENLMMGGVGDKDLFRPYYKAIAECCDYAAEKGVGISIKPHGGLNATGLQCRKIIELVGHENFRIWYDPGNIFYYSDGKLDPVDDAATVDGLVVGMCIKDYRHPKDVLVTPGTGQVDFAKVLARLKQGGFVGGPLLIECLAPGGLGETVAEAKKARRFVESLVRNMGDKPVESVKKPQYVVRKALVTPAPEGRWDGAAWRDVEPLEVSHFFKVGSLHRPATLAKVLFDDTGLYIHFRVEDKYVRAIETQYHGKVWEDACVEFFVKPKKDRGYFNFEINCGGTMLLSYHEAPGWVSEGPRRSGSVPWEMASKVRIYHSMPGTVDPEIEDEVVWHIEYHIPFWLLEEYIGPLGDLAGQEWHANFYKCAENNSHPHWATWSPILGKLDFHQPEYFGVIRFEE